MVLARAVPGLLVAAALAALAPAAAGAPAARTLRVAAAANLQAALSDIASGFRARHPGVAVEPSFAASGLLVAQIQQGAPFDLFLAADAASPARVAEAGLADGPPFTYAIGRLVLWFPDPPPPELEKRGLAVLLDPSIRRIAIGNPAVAPYGAAAVEALRAAGVYDAVKEKLVLGQNIGQAAQFAQSGNAQAAFLPLSLAMAPPLSREGRSLAVPAGSHRPIVQAGAVLEGARDRALARAFADYLLGPEGRAALERNGYGLPPAK